MNERMSDLLDLASDDGGAPLGFSGDAVARRARARRRRRHSGFAVGLVAASVAVVVGVSQLVGSPAPAEKHGVVDPSTKTPSAHSSSPRTPALTAQEQRIVDRCVHRAGFLRGWTLDAHAQDEQGVTATFVNADHTRWASCQLSAAGSQLDDEVDRMGGVPRGPVPKSWYGPNGFRHQGATVAWAQVCTPGEGKVCAREVFSGALARYVGVASAVVDAPDGTRLHPVLGHYTYVFRHTEQRVDPHRAANDMQALPSMPVTLLDGSGRRIIRYDYFPSYVVPDSCPSNGGC